MGIGKKIGRGLGSLLGKVGSSLSGGSVSGKCGQEVGGAIGGGLGSLLPFKKGGRVRRNTRALLHKGEYVLPRGVNPTRSQVKMVKKRGGRK